MRSSRLPSVNVLRVVFLAVYLAALALPAGPGGAGSGRLLAAVLLIAVVAPGVVRDLPGPPRVRRSLPGR